MHNGLKFLDTAGNTHAVSEDHPLPVTSPGGGAFTGLTDTQLRATPVPVSGTVAVTGVATAAGVAVVATDLGPATARPAVTDPTLAADINQLLRGILTALNTIAVNTTPP